MSLKDIKIKDLNLSGRTAIRLEREGIDYLFQLVTYSERELLKIVGFGKKCITEVRDKLKSIDEELSLDMETIKISEKFDIDPVEICELSYPILSNRLHGLSLSYPAINALQTAGITTISQLVSYNPVALSIYTSLDSKAIKNIDQLLSSRFNLQLGMDEESKALYASNRSEYNKRNKGASNYPQHRYNAATEENVRLQLQLTPNPFTTGFFTDIDQISAYSEFLEKQNEELRKAVQLQEESKALQEQYAQNMASEIAELKRHKLELMKAKLELGLSDEEYEMSEPPLEDNPNQLKLF